MIAVLLVIYICGLPMMTCWSFTANAVNPLHFPWDPEDSRMHSWKEFFLRLSIWPIFLSVNFIYGAYLLGMIFIAITPVGKLLEIASKLATRLVVLFKKITHHHK